MTEKHTAAIIIHYHHHQLSYWSLSNRPETSYTDSRTKCTTTTVSYRAAINGASMDVQILRRQQCGGSVAKLARRRHRAFHSTRRRGGRRKRRSAATLHFVVLYTVLIKILWLPLSARAGVSGVEGVWSLRAAVHGNILDAARRGCSLAPPRCII